MIEVILVSVKWIMNRTKGFFSLLGCGLLLACFGLLVRILNQYIGPLTQAGGRMLIAGLLIVPYLIIKRIPFITKPQNKLLFSSFILSFPLYIIFFTLSVISTKAANAFFYLFASTTLTSFVIGKMFFKERVMINHFISAILLILGLIFLAYPFNFIQSGKGIITGIIGGVLYGVSNATRKFYADKVNRWTVMLYQMVSGAGLSFILTWFFNEFNRIKIAPVSITTLIVFGIGLVIIQILLFTGFKNFQLNIGSIVLASQLIFIEIIGVIFLKEIPTSFELLGSIIIILAIVLSNLRLRKIYA
ncbi:hypothetical protein COX59_00210 [Candidatus Beckwithbacteria bacterium CG_4_10_14_0_2_um_filter_47_25]|uniref:EamA domain-containing protein n=3 Tax=Candidatus Beckwithiibacteriota TaxID=1752726 RepID=A0A2M8G3G5_9BACT|nr:MAG: hypothetical protein COX59_00210 [Candidatus Beckwithbacteria bacterium CG_4_10_14_0_2_um_filter_47_25]PJC66181.1 MAG: hypothetical protein CO018_03255 [Candidatus Beckwithbacteria bacterium CG_4_9_14_0_2_um_filter_47_11]